MLFCLGDRAALVQQSSTNGNPHLYCVILHYLSQSIYTLASHKQPTRFEVLCWRNIPSAWGVLSAERISPVWSWCAEIPLPTTWSYLVPWSQCWRTGQSQANFHRREQGLCGHVTADKVKRDEETFLEHFVITL